MTSVGSCFVKRSSFWEIEPRFERHWETDLFSRRCFDTRQSSGSTNVSPPMWTLTYGQSDDEQSIDVAENFIIFGMWIVFSVIQISRSAIRKFWFGWVCSAPICDNCKLRSANNSSCFRSQLWSRLRSRASCDHGNTIWCDQSIVLGKQSTDSLGLRSTWIVCNGAAAVALMWLPKNMFCSNK